MPELKILLDESDFRKLVSGRIVELEAPIKGSRYWVRIGLRDIHWNVLIKALRDAMESNTYDPRPANDLLGTGAKEETATEKAIPGKVSETPPQQAEGGEPQSKDGPFINGSEGGNPT